eukprot:m.224818 g.224818  ORF g.224818 m.224818 type:complete len:107 (+) comp25890_c0_seq4:807-1127(+)
MCILKCTQPNVPSSFCVAAKTYCNRSLQVDEVEGCLVLYFDVVVRGTPATIAVTGLRALVEFESHGNLQALCLHQPNVIENFTMQLREQIGIPQIGSSVAVLPCPV